jgi:signal transduction histidine kinase
VSTPSDALAALPADRGARRLALAAVLVSVAVFLAAAPYAKVPLPPVPAFIPIYQSALVLCDIITAVLLFTQFGILGSRALLVLASGYLFSALMAVAHALSFPGLFAPGGLLGAGPQTTAWIYFLWHGGFPLLVTAYAVLKDDGAQRPAARDTSAALRYIGMAIVATILAVAALVLLATNGHDVLPAIMQGNRDAPTKVLVAAATWILSLTALVTVWRRRPHSVVDIWLLVTMCAWLFDIALAAVLNGARFDLGFYAGRVYGLLASSFVLIVLLTESSLLHGRLLEAHRRERAERQLVQQKSNELVAANKELDAFSYSVSHDLRAPLRAVDGYARMLEEDYGTQLDAEGRRLIGVVRASSAKMARLIEDLLLFARAGREAMRVAPVSLTPLVREVAEELNAQVEHRIEFAIGDLGSVQGDPVLLRQVFLNLLSNAMKFSRDRNPAIVEVGRVADADAGADAPASYFVKDNGVGFDMKYYARLFSVFQRLHSAAEFPGTGVGLAIVNRIVARHGGRVWAEAAPEQGATFHFTLRAAPNG